MDIYSSKLIWSIAKNMEVSEFFVFFIKQLVHEDNLFIPYRIRKRQFLAQAMKDKREKHVEKILNKLKYLLLPNNVYLFSYENYFFQFHMVNL